MVHLMEAGDTVAFSTDGLTQSAIYAPIPIDTVFKAPDRKTGGHVYSNGRTLMSSPATYRGTVTHFALFDKEGTQVWPWTKMTPRSVLPGDTLQFSMGSLSVSISGLEEKSLRQEASGFSKGFRAQRSAEQEKIHALERKYNEQKEEFLRILSPAHQDFIFKIENNHMTVADFQKMRGITADGIVGPQTSKMLADLAYQKQKAIELAMMVEGLPAVPKPKGFIKYDNREPIDRDKIQHRPNANASGWVQVPVKVTPVKPAPMTLQQFSDIFDSLGWHIQRDVRLGWHVYVDLTEGGQWQYWRPFKSWADRTGSKRTLREVEKLERLFESGQVESFSMRDLGVTPSGGKSLDDELFEKESSDTAEALSDWDSAFQKTQEATTGTDVVLFEKKAS